MLELKPCPLCGGDAEIIRNISTKTPRVFCKACRCNTGGYKTEADAISAWNRRFEQEKMGPYNTFDLMAKTAKKALKVQND